MAWKLLPIAIYTLGPLDRMAMIMRGMKKAVRQISSPEVGQDRKLLLEQSVAIAAVRCMNVRV